MKNDSVKKEKIHTNKKEIIITLVVLVIAVIIGFIAGKFLYEAVYGTI